jgi:hypothetical protein
MVGSENAGDSSTEIADVRRLLGPRLRILAGGSGAASRRLSLKKAGIELCGSRLELRAALDDIWTNQH